MIHTGKPESTSWLDTGSLSFCHIGAPRAIAELYVGEQSADVWGTGGFSIWAFKAPASSPHPALGTIL